jgi:hypothetical protein
LVWVIARVVAGSSTRRLFYFADLTVRRIATGLTPAQGTQVAETPYKAPQDNEPGAVQQGPSSRVTLSVVSLAALAIIGAATANFLPHPDRLALPTFDWVSLPSLSLPKFDRLALPGFKSTPAPSPAPSPAPAPPAPARLVAAPAPPKPAVLPLPDPIVNAALRDIQSSQRDIQSSQQQNATSLVLLRDSSATQQTELKRISRQLTALTAQVDALHGSMATMTTGSITPSSGIAHSNPRARLTRGSKRAYTPPPAPEPPSSKPVGPVSVGGAPLGPAPVRSGA